MPQELDQEAGSHDLRQMLATVTSGSRMPSLSSLDPAVVDDLLDMLHDVMSSWARGESAAPGDWAARILAAQIPAYAALGRLTRLHHETQEVTGPNDTWLVLVRRSMQLLLEAVDCMGQAAKARDRQA